jgi:parallel beta-helix repeat protein
MFRTGKVCRYAASLILVLFLLNFMPVMSVNVQRQDVGSKPKIIPSIRANDPHEPIAIDGDANFSATALAEGWSGDGSAQDPYIIENYDITLSSIPPEASISITNTRAIYTIRGCNLIGPAATPSYGIYLMNSTNGHIVNNLITNFANGLYVIGGSSNVVVTGNNISYNSYSIHWENSGDLEITQNICVGNFFDCIFVSDSDKGVISGNDCSYNGGHAIYLESSDSYTLTDNICFNNTWNGFRIFFSYTYLLENNTSTGNEVAVHTFMSDYINVSWNIFANSTLVNGVTDINNGIFEFNYWSDYGGVDADEDGFGDTSYTFTGATDDSPLMYPPFPVEWAQLVADQYLEFGEYFEYNIGINCPAPHTFHVNDSTNFWTGVPTLSSSTTLAVGDYPLLVNVTNIYGYFTEAIFTVFVRDTTSPTISEPDDLSFGVGEEYQTIEWIAQDLSPLSFVVLRNGSEVTSDSTAQTSVHFSMILESYQAGVFNYTMVVTDAYGNVAFDTVLVTIIPRPFLEVMLPWLIVGCVAVVIVIVVIVLLKKRKAT